MRLRFVKLITLVFLAVCLAACAGKNGSPFEQGQEAFKAGDYKTAFQLLYPIAVQGEPDAEYAVGYMLYYGKGVPANPAVGQGWIREAAVHNQLQARRALELLTQKGMFDINSSN